MLLKPPSAYTITLNVASLPDSRTEKEDAARTRLCIVLFCSLQMEDWIDCAHRGVG